MCDFYMVCVLEPILKIGCGYVDYTDTSVRHREYQDRYLIVNWANSRSDLSILFYVKLHTVLDAVAYTLLFTTNVAMTLAKLYTICSG